MRGYVGLTCDLNTHILRSAICSAGIRVRTHEPDTSGMKYLE